jgi:putative oxidoreductase
MVTFMSRYPDGAAGAGLLLLRIACAFGVFSAPLRLLLPMRLSAFSFAAAIVFALAIVLGFGTRTVALLLVAATSSAAVAGDANVALIIAHAGSCAALALLGPGAYSIDANTFGRSVVRFKPRNTETEKDG